MKIGINGFGRIGRLVFRIAAQRDDIEVVGVNDLLKVEQLAYLLKYDSVHGKYFGKVEVKNDSLFVDGKQIRVTSLKKPISSIRSASSSTTVWILSRRMVLRL